MNKSEKKQVFDPLILDLQRMNPVTETWAEIGLLKEARYSLLFLFECDHFSVDRNNVFFFEIWRTKEI